MIRQLNSASIGSIDTCVLCDGDDTCSPCDASDYDCHDVCVSIDHCKTDDE